MNVKVFYHDNYLIQEIDNLGSNYIALTNASIQIKSELEKFKSGKLDDPDYKHQLEEAYEFVERRLARIPYDPGE